MLQIIIDISLMGITFIIIVGLVAAIADYIGWKKSLASPQKARILYGITKGKKID